MVSRTFIVMFAVLLVISTAQGAPIFSMIGDAVEAVGDTVGDAFEAVGNFFGGEFMIYNFEIKRYILIFSQFFPKKYIRHSIFSF